jgi:uncharacterized protein (TIGR03435 family)
MPLRLLQSKLPTPSGRIRIGAAICLATLSFAPQPFGTPTTLAAGREAQEQKTGPNAVASSLPTFDVASVKPTDPNDGEMNTFLVYPGGRLEARGCTLNYLIMVAYNVRAFQVSGGPSWAGRDGSKFNIAAKPPADSDLSKIAPNNPKLPPPDEERLMLRALLAARFKLGVQESTALASGLALVLKEHSPNLTEAKDKDAYPVVVFGQSGNAESPYYLQGINAPMARFAQRLSDLLSTAVVDRTGLQGSFDFKFEYSPDAGDARATGPQLSTAIQEIGLKLESAKVPIAHITIETAEKPSEN